MNGIPLRRAYEVVENEVEIVAEYDHEYIHNQFVNDTGGLTICSGDNGVWLPWDEVPNLIAALTLAMQDHKQHAADNEKTKGGGESLESWCQAVKQLGAKPATVEDIFEKPTPAPEGRP